MPRQRTPTNIHILNGTHKVNPERMRERLSEPEAAPFPKAPPKYLPPEVKTAWQAITDVVPAGVLKAPDIFVVEQLAILIAEMRENPFKMTSGNRSQLRLTLGALGMTPADRSKVMVDKKPINEFDDI